MITDCDNLNRHSREAQGESRFDQRSSAPEEPDAICKRKRLFGMKLRWKKGEECSVMVLASIMQVHQASSRSSSLQAVPQSSSPLHNNNTPVEVGSTNLWFLQQKSTLKEVAPLSKSTETRVTHVTNVSHLELVDESAIDVGTFLFLCTLTLFATS